MLTSNSLCRVTRYAATFCRIVLLGFLLGCYARMTLAEVFFSENFNSYDPGTCIGGPVWTQDYGCVTVIKTPHPNWDGNAVDGTASNDAPQNTTGASITVPIANIPTTGIVELSFRAWAPTNSFVGGYIALNTLDSVYGYGVLLQNWTNSWADNEWILQADPVFSGSGPILFQSPSRFMRDRDVQATIVLDYDAHEFWANLSDGSSNWTTPKLPFAGVKITGISVYEDDRGGTHGLDVDDIVLTATASPAIKPTTGGNVGTVTMSLNNFNLAPGTTIRLSAPGVPDIVGKDTEVVSTKLTRTTFDLVGATPGARNVVATPSTGNEISLPNAFEIINGGGPLLGIDLVGYARPRFGRDTNYLAVVRNIGFNDTYPGRVTVAVDGEASTSVQENRATTNSNPLASGFLFNDLVNNLSPGSFQAFRFSYTPKSAGCKDITGEFKDPCEKERLEAWNSWSDIQLDYNGALSPAWAEWFREGCDQHPDTTACRDIARKALEALIQFALDYVDYAKAMADLRACEVAHGLPPSPVPPPPPVPPGAIPPLPPKPQLPPQPNPPTKGVTTSLHVCPLMSWDPNDKVGPSGFGAKGYLSSSLPFAYTVHFENLPSASAAAQDVAVTDQLDTDLDWTTFELGGIQFGDQFVEVPTGYQDFSTTVDLRPGRNLAVKIDAKLDPKTGLATWQFKSVDPDTGDVPSDPAAGFLSPNKVPPEGEASVFFTVRAKEGAQTGTEIRNKATVVFDVNPPIETGQWLNTIDNTQPQSKVLPLAGVQPSPTFQVQWIGTDEESGIREYTVYVSENNGPASVLVNNTADTSMSFTGKPGNSYAFYSMAMDHAGNVEDIPKVPDTSTRIILPGDLNGDGMVDCTDIGIIKASFGKRTGQPGFDPRADVTNDGIVDTRDLSFVSRQLPAGTTCK